MNAIDLIRKLLDIVQIEGNEAEICIRVINRDATDKVTHYKEIPIESVKIFSDQSGKCGIRLEQSDFHSTEWIRA